MKKLTILAFLLIFVVGCTNVTTNKTVNTTKNNTTTISTKNVETTSKGKTTKVITTTKNITTTNVKTTTKIVTTKTTESLITTTNKKEAKLSFANNIPSDYLFNAVSLYYGDQEIPIYNVKVNFAHTWDPEAPNRMNNGVVILGLDGEVTLTLKTTFNINNTLTIRPLEKEVQKEILNNNEIEFTIKEKGQYTIELSNDRTIHLFVDEYGYFEKYRNSNEYANYIYFGPGVHNKNNSSNINSNNLIELNSNTLVFIDEGAIVEAGFIANYKNNIAIVGNGIISGAPFDRSANTNSKLIPYEFNYCTNLIFDGITTLDPAGWCYNLYFSKDILLDNIKIISSRSNGDGVSIQSCERVDCLNSFVRSWDDSLVVKNYPEWSNKNNEGTTRDIYFYNCVLWTDLAQSMEIGYETVGEVMEDITFEKITVLHNFHKAPMSIHNANNANIKNVLFKDIIVEDAAMGKGDGKNVLVELTCEFSTTWSNGHKKTSLGQTDGVTFENIHILSSNNPLISIRGSIDARSEYDDTVHYVSNVKFINFYIGDTILTEAYNNLEMVYVNNVTFN